MNSFAARDMKEKKKNNPDKIMYEINISINFIVYMTSTILRHVGYKAGDNQQQEDYYLPVSVGKRMLDYTELLM